MHIRHLGLRPYLETWDAMRTYTAVRDRDSADELWLVQHPPVFTQGQAGKTEHLLAPGDIPVMHIDRGAKYLPRPRTNHHVPAARHPP